MQTDFSWHFVIAQDAGVAPGIAGRSGGETAATQGTPADPGAIGDPNAANAPPAGGGGSGMIVMMVMLFGFLILMTLMSGRQQKKQQRERSAMLDALRKHDRVVTRGGMIGTIVELRSEELVLRVDESTGARATFARSAVESVVKPAGGPSEAPAEHDVIEEAEPVGAER